ncbi:MAG: ChbG/HpnK family deacetylase [Atopobiaceae bacterium]|nr:ChbG/HpnK family deacetylase [Atopobiaceae bacterium]
MTRILLRADDLGYSIGVNFGLAWACDNGLPMSVGLMVNLPDVRHGYELIAGKGHCLGVHTTISAGRPLSDPADVPSLVDENGAFHPSDFYRIATSDPAALADVEREAEAQYQAFCELTGREPDYVDVHAVSSESFIIGACEVAERHGKPFSYLAPSGHTMRVGSSDLLLHGSQGDLDQLIAAVMTADAQASKPIVHALMLHPGFVDAQLMRTSSLTLPRTVDAEILRRSELQELAMRDYVELVTYRDL